MRLAGCMVVGMGQFAVVVVMLRVIQAGFLGAATTFRRMASVRAAAEDGVREDCQDGDGAEHFVHDLPKELRPTRSIAATVAGVQTDLRHATGCNQTDCTSIHHDITSGAVHRPLLRAIAQKHRENKHLPRRVCRVARFSQL